MIVKDYFSQVNVQEGQDFESFTFIGKTLMIIQVFSYILVPKVRQNMHKIDKNLDIRRKRCPAKIFVDVFLTSHVSNLQICTYLSTATNQPSFPLPLTFSSLLITFDF